MKEHFERTLHQKVSVEENTELLKKLPLAFKGRYILFDVRTNNLQWLAIQPKNDTGLVMLRKDYNKIRALTTLNCALFLNNISAYIKEKLLDEGNPFVIKDKQMYLPFIGCVLFELY